VQYGYSPTFRSNKGLDLQGRREMNLPFASAAFLLGLIFYLEDGDKVFLQNMELSPNYMVL
jgi:hypothetical protein